VPAEENKAVVRRFFEDCRIVLEHVIAEGELVAVNTRFTGTHREVFAWLNYGPWPPTGKSTDVREMFVFRVAGGRMVEVWSAWDQLSLARQLGGEPAASGDDLTESSEPLPSASTASPRAPGSPPALRRRGALP
jgi:hypothetical protein